MKDLKVSNETHSLLFSLKNKLILSHNKKFTYDEVLIYLINSSSAKTVIDFGNALNTMYQLEEKQ